MSSVAVIIAATAALVGASVLTVGLTPQLRRLALASGFVDRPAARKSHVRPTAYLGGVAIMAGTLFGLVVTGRLSASMAAIALVAALLGAVGLVDDDRSLPASVRLLAQVAAAIVVLAVGIRAQVTGVVAIDVAITLVWVVAITNAVNFLDNMDGLAAGISAAAGSAVFVLAIVGGQAEMARLSGALVGASLAFLVYNHRPASIFMGDAGSMFLGFLLAVVAIGVDPALMPPMSFAVPLLVLALPVLDISTVVVGRLRRGRSVGEAGKDHLSHRLVAKGLSPGLAVVALIGAELMLSSLAVFVGRGLVAVPVAGVVAVLVVLAVLVGVASAPVYHEQVAGSPRRFRLAVLSAAAIVGGLLVAPAIFSVDGTSTSVSAITTSQGRGINDSPITLTGQASGLGPSMQDAIPQAVVASGLVVVLVALFATTRRRLRTSSVPDRAAGPIPGRVAALRQPK